MANHVYRTKLTTLIVAGTFLAIIAAAHADDTFNLKRIYKTGESDRYRTTITIDTTDPSDGKAAKVVFTIATTDETKEIKFDGSVLLSMKIDSATIGVNGAEQPVPLNNTSFATTLDKSGKIIKQDLGEGLAAQIC